MKFQWNQRRKIPNGLFITLCVVKSTVCSAGKMSGLEIPPRESCMGEGSIDPPSNEGPTMLFHEVARSVK